MKDDYKSPFFGDDEEDIRSFSADESDDLFSNSENQLDLNSFARNRNEEGEKPQPKWWPFQKGGKKSVLKTVLSVCLVLTITFCLIVGSFMIYVFGFVDDDIEENLFDLKLNYTTTIYVKDNDAGKYVEYQRLHGSENRIWVSYDKTAAEAEDPTYTGIPQNLAQAFVDIEDQRFMDHNGVDWKRTFAAFVNMFVDLYSSNQGGSTITQQLVKNLTGDRDQSPMRKIREIMRARKLEGEYYKDTILECYLNTISFANGICGVEVAANYYFDKSVNELTLAECASLAAIVKEPERYRPDKNPEDNKARRKLVLDKMLELEHITKEQYDAAIAEEVKIVADKGKLNEVEVNSYFVDALIDDVVEGLVEEKGMDKSYAEQNFYNGGYKIYCTLDVDIQEAIDSVYSEMSRFPNSKKTGEAAQSAFTIMDYNGNVLGISGGSGEKTTNRGLNRATDSPRPPGSSIKPLATYSLALENNIITYSSKLEDKYYQMLDGKKWPVNSYGYYSGSMFAFNALERSANTIPVHLVEKLGPEAIYNHLTENFGFTTFVHSSANSQKNDLNASALGLGGATTGITTLEACAAYASFGNKGKYYEPTFYTRVADQHGNIILENESTGKVAIAEDTAVIMNHMMQRVVNGGQGTAKTVRSYMGSMPVYGKTGTTDSKNDVWFSGGTPYYVASCWYGYDTPESVSDGNAAKKIWGSIMSKVHKGLKVKDFEDSEYVTCRAYCTSSGMIATEKCTSVGYGWYKTSQLQPCTTHGGSALGEVTAIPDDTSSTASGTSSTTSNASKPATSSAPATSTPANASSPQQTTSNNKLESLLPEIGLPTENTNSKAQGQ